MLGIGLYDKKPNQSEEKKWFEGLTGEISSGNAFSYVAEADGKLVGMCAVRRREPRADSRHVGLLGISIIDGYRSRGIGRALMERTIRSASSRYGIIVLSVYSFNKHAIRLYRRLGFKKYGILPGGLVRRNMAADDVFMYLETATCRRHTRKRKDI